MSSSSSSQSRLRSDRASCGSRCCGRYLAVIASRWHPEKCNFKYISRSSREILARAGNAFDYPRSKRICIAKGSVKNFERGGWMDREKFEGSNWRQLTLLPPWDTLCSLIFHRENRWSLLSPASTSSLTDERAASTRPRPRGINESRPTQCGK